MPIRALLTAVAALLVVQAGSVVTSARQGPAPAGPAEAAAQEPQPTFRAGINFVRVDVIVTTGRAEPVTDLTADDFEVLEDGRPQRIEQFRLVRVDGNPAPGAPPPRAIRTTLDEETEAARDDVRLFVIFLDDYHVRPLSALAVKAPLTRFLQTQLRPEDMVAVMYPLTPVDDIRFTRDHAAVAAAVERFEGRKFRYEPRNQFEEQYVRASTQAVEEIRNQVVMGALQGAATRLGSLREGRKSIIFVSEGFTALLPPQMRNEDASMSGRCVSPGIAGCSPASGNPTAGDDDPREETARAFETGDLLSRMNDVFAAANRNNTAIYALDPRGLAMNEFGIEENIGPRQDATSLRATQDTLRALADETDGRAIVNRNDLAGGLAQVARDSSAYYLLGYNSAQAPTDGKFHPITVRVKRRGVEVRARKGYWAATVADVVRASAPAAPAAAGPSKAVEHALAAIATSVYSGKYIRTWIGSERGADGKTRLTVVWEPVAASPGARREQPGRMSVLAASERGDLLFRGRSDDGVSASVTPAAGRGGGAAATVAAAPQRMEFEVPPGKVELRLSLEAAEGGVLDNETRTISVPDLTGPDSGLGTPRVFRARTARDFQALVSDGAATPAPAREFSRTERLLVRFSVYNGRTPAAALLNRGGQKMSDLAVTPATAGGTHQIDLALGGLPPGEYLVQITSADATELVAFRVTS